MSGGTGLSSGTGLRRFASGRATATGPGEPRSAQEKCELCSTGVPDEHGHVADLEQSSLLCACRACYLLFTRCEAGGGRYRAVPGRYLADPARPLSAAQWEALEVPVGLAFFLQRSRRAAVTCFYPSPAGVTECRLDLRAWERLASAYPLLRAMAPDVEAILIAHPDSGTPDPGTQGSGIECFLVPVDACYELAGRMRLLWRGFDGGAQARASIGEFLDLVRARAAASHEESAHG